MNRSRCSAFTLVVGTALLGIAADVASACSVCFGDPSSGMVKGAKAGVLMLAVLVYVVLIGMAGTAGLWIVRSRRIAIAQQGVDHEATLSTDINPKSSTK
jgi:hypothetical protein